MKDGFFQKKKITTLNAISMVALSVVLVLNMILQVAKLGKIANLILSILIIIFATLLIIYNSLLLKFYLKLRKQAKEAQKDEVKKLEQDDSKTKES